VRVQKEKRYIEHLRAQAARCARYAERLADRGLADRLAEIGRELEEEADRREAELAERAPHRFWSWIRHGSRFAALFTWM
jgi:hypothetical protein